MIRGERITKKDVLWSFERWVKNSEPISFRDFMDLLQDEYELIEDWIRECYKNE